VLAVNVSFTYRTVAAVKVMLAVLPVEGLKVYPCDGTSVV
jgi:hypothetical protein